MRRVRRSVLSAGVALVLAAGGVTAGIAATSGGPAVPSLYLAGIAENPCTHQPLTVPVSAAGQFLPDSSVLNTTRQTSCVAGAVAASKQWLGSGRIPGDSLAQRELATRALLDLRLSVQPDGAVVAGFHHGWDYTWPRDSSWVSAALAGTGHAEQALSILRFLQRVQSSDGTFEARYYTDGSGPVRDGRPAELDAVGWVPWAVWAWAATQRTSPGSPARGELQQLWPMVTKAAGAAVRSLTSSGLPEPAMDYWENKPIEQTLGTAAPLLAGLRAAAGLAGLLNLPDDEARWTSAATRLSAAIVRLFGSTGYQRTPDAGSGADTAVTFLGPPLATPDAAVEAAARSAQRALTLPNGGLRPGAAWHGASGVAWTPETAMFALFDAATGQKAAAEQLLAWLAGHRTALGELPEQVSGVGRPVSVTPLAWTDAIVLLTLLAQDQGLSIPPPG